MVEIPKGRWFQFRLRTLLIGIVLIGAACGYVGHEWRTVAARRNWLDQHPSVLIKSGILRLEEDKIVPPDPTIPLVRRWLGDEPIKYLEVNNPDEEETAQHLFPEAKVVRRFGYSY